MFTRMPNLDSKSNLNYLLISIALVQSELYWFCSVLYILCKQSGLIHEESKTTIVKRNRSHSAPPNYKPQNNETKEEQERRCSLQQDTTEEPLPVVGQIRKRPTIKDEETGTTCPPTWWQKTRVKLGHAPVHGDPKPKSILSSQRYSATSPTIMIGFTDEVEKACLDSNISETTTTTTTDSHQGDTLSSSPFFTSTSSSDIDANSMSNKSTRRRKNLLSKINQAIRHHHHRRNNSLDTK